MTATDDLKACNAAPAQIPAIACDDAAAGQPEIPTGIGGGMGSQKAFDVHEAARLLGCHRELVRAHVRGGVLHPASIDLATGRWEFTRPSLRRDLQACAERDFRVPAAWRVLTLKDAARALGRSYGQTARDVRAGRIRVIRLGKTIRVEATEVARYAALLDTIAKDIAGDCA